MDEKKELLKGIGLRIKQERERRGVSSETLAYESGISKSNLSEIERGLRDVRISTLGKIAEGLEIPISKLLKH